MYENCKKHVNWKTTSQNLDILGDFEIPAGTCPRNRGHGHPKLIVFVKASVLIKCIKICHVR